MHEVLASLARAMTMQTELLTMLANQQQAILEILMQDAEADEDEPMVDMEGLPVSAR